ncbi:MAG: hypothetical protein FWD75_00985 [Propionibacteriaceae bacterium]|nr:hypothetical protein [Propionibacteriaceae bacterium]
MSDVVIRQRPGGSVRSLQVEVDWHGRRWVFDSPGWSPLGFGLNGDVPYAWTARQLIVVIGDDVGVLATLDDDIHLVLKVDEVWIVVCETSVRSLRGDREVGRIEFGEVVMDSWWQDERLHCAMFDGTACMITMRQGRLLANWSSE